MNFFDMALRELTAGKEILTAEERRVEVYSTSETPTQASSVTGRTPLAALNLNWREAELRERERTKHVHRLHPYLGKYIPQLVEIFLRKFFKAGQTVFDPFAGSGTTLVQANELGINAVGCDISAFNVLLTKAKTSKYSIPHVRKEVTDILERVQADCGEAGAQSLLALGDTPCTLDEFEASEYLTSWFAPQALRELIRFRDLIPEYKHQDLLKVILSRSARSARLTTHFDLDFPKKPQTHPYECFKHSRVCQPTTTAFQFLRRYGLDTIKRIEEFSTLRTGAAVKVMHGDSRKIKPGSIDGVITSPPYVGLIDYHEQHRYAYELLGLEDRREAEIGAAKKGSGLKAKQQYKELMVEVFENALAYLPAGGRMIVVAGDRHGLYPEIAKACAVNEEAVIQRHVNRRTGMRAGEFYESVFIWTKP